MMSVAELMIHMVFTAEEFFEVAIEGWSYLDLKPGPLNSVETFRPAEVSGNEFSSQPEKLCTATPIS